MLATVNTTGGGQLAFMVAPDAANTASTVTDTAGARLFPNMTPTVGAILGVPAMVSDRITAGRIVLVDGTGFMVNEGAADVDRAEGAALKMQTDPGPGAAELVALWQNNMVALRVIADFGAERVRDNAAAILDSAAAAWIGATI